MNFFHLSPAINVVLPIKMDLEKIKRFADSQFEGWKIAKAVTEVKNEIKNAEQGRDIAMSDVFKTLREPLIEQQKKTDAKQDAVIDQLKANQLALTGGLRDLVESNRDVLTLQQELPQIATPLEEESGVTQASVENRFDKDDKIILKNFGLPKPSELMGMADGNLEAIKQASLTHAKEVSKKISGKKRHITSLEKKAVTVPQKDRDDLESFTREKKSLSTYANTVDDVLNLRKYYVKPKQGSGIRKYKQPKRNAYKISDSAYGNLSVDVPRLINEMKLNVFRGGKLIYEADADKSLIDLLTKRFNPRKRYSLNAVKIFNDLNLLANLPRHPSSGKSKLLGSGVVYYNDPNELAERMKILVGSMAAGNNSPVIKNDLSMINDEFLRIGAIDQTMHEKFYKKYIK